MHYIMLSLLIDGDLLSDLTKQREIFEENQKLRDNVRHKQTNKTPSIIIIVANGSV